MQVLKQICLNSIACFLTLDLILVKIIDIIF